MIRPSKGRVFPLKENLVDPIHPESLPEGKAKTGSETSAAKARGEANPSKMPRSEMRKPENERLKIGNPFARTEK
jgi:hypothetical protein